MTTTAASFNDNITGLRKQTTMRSTCILPEDFVLSSSDVLCGRGSHCFNHEGNRTFRKLVASRLQRYSSATTKHDKTQIICEIIDQVREDSPLGGFVKRDLETGRYYEVGDFHAREKTSQAFRDALQEKYKSSYVSRKKFRKRLHNSDPCLATSNNSSFFQLGSTASTAINTFQWPSELQETSAIRNRSSALWGQTLMANEDSYLASSIQNKIFAITNSVCQSQQKPEDVNHYSWLERFNPVDNDADHINSKSDAIATKKDFIPAMRKNSLASHCVSFNDTQFGSSLANFPDLSGKSFLFENNVGNQIDPVAKGDDNIFERLLQLTDYDPIQANAHVAFDPIPLP